MAKQLRTARHKALMAVIAAERKKAGLTQRELAAKMGRADSFFGKIESGERQLNVLEFCEVADAFGVNPKNLFAKVIDYVSPT